MSHLWVLFPLQFKFSIMKLYSTNIFSSFWVNKSVDVPLALRASNKNYKRQFPSLVNE
jgi:hypothetical protein